VLIDHSGSIFIKPMSSRIWCVAPSSPNVNPACEAQIFYVLVRKLLIDEFGHTLPVEKLAKVPRGIFPPIVNPAAIHVCFIIRFGKNAPGGFLEIIKF
jgi:hypothetical protein